jgi:Na+/glutamate symporter
MLFSLSGGPGFFAGDTQWFQIWDQRNGISAAYFRGAVGVQIPMLPKVGKLASILTGGGVTKAGPWNVFTTSVDFNVSNFNGMAAIGSATSGNVAGELAGKDGASSSITPFALRTMNRDDERNSTSVNIANFDTGDTVQLLPSAAATLGPFVIVIWASLVKGGNDGVFPYTG